MKKNRNEVWVGFFVLIGSIAFSLMVFFVSGVYLFREGYSIYVTYDYVSILDKGAPVRMAGVRVGEVSAVELVPDDETGGLDVKVKLFIDAQAKIRENYEFEIRGTHILSEPHIEISPKEGSAPLVQNGTMIVGKKLVPMEDLIKNAHNTLAGIDQIVNGKLEGADGETKKIFIGLKESTDKLNTILNKINQGEGTAGKMVSSDELYQDVRGLIAEIKARPWRLLKRDKEVKPETTTKKRFGIF